MSKRKFTGSSAWEQMVGQQMSLLAKFDEAKRQAKGHEVQTYHGEVAESEFRKWLGDFLPKRFGVTSGYVVAQQSRGVVQFPHFDVIVYDKLEAPILWIEDNADRSEQGKSRALPVEYVRGVLEVKATYGPAETKDAMEHLRDLAPFYSDVDPDGERYRRYLPASFFCALVFFDATSDAIKSQACKEHLSPINAPRGFCGGTVLRGGTQLPGTSGLLSLIPAPKLTDSGWRCELFWGNMCFSRFAFDIVAKLNGTYTLGMVSSLNAFPPLEFGMPKPGKDGIIDPKNIDQAE
jgi:hypothetical protein